MITLPDFANETESNEFFAPIILEALRKDAQDNETPVPLDEYDSAMEQLEDYSGSDIVIVYFNRRVVVVRSILPFENEGLLVIDLDSKSVVLSSCTSYEDGQASELNLSKA